MYLKRSSAVKLMLYICSRAYMLDLHTLTFANWKKLASKAAIFIFGVCRPSWGRSTPPLPSFLCSLELTLILGTTTFKTQLLSFYPQQQPCNSMV